MSVESGFEQIKNSLNNRIEQNIDSAKKAVLSEIKNDVDEYVPYRIGALASNVSMKPTESTITYTEDYASYAFNPISSSGKPKQYSQEVHSKAQGNPFEAASEQNDKEWADLFAKELMKRVDNTQ
jgi:hypothetical protein